MKMKNVNIELVTVSETYVDNYKDFHYHSKKVISEQDLASLIDELKKHQNEYLYMVVENVENTVENAQSDSKNRTLIDKTHYAPSIYTIQLSDYKDVQQSEISGKSMIKSAVLYILPLDGFKLYNEHSIRFANYTWNMECKINYKLKNGILEPELHNVTLWYYDYKESMGPFKEMKIEYDKDTNTYEYYEKVITVKVNENSEVHDDVYEVNLKGEQAKERIENGLLPEPINPATENAEIIAGLEEMLQKGIQNVLEMEQQI